MTANRKVKWHFVFAIAGAVVATNADNAVADICEAVLKYKAFDINDDKVYHDFRQASYDALCMTGWHNLQEYNTKTGNLDTSGKYLEIFKGGTHGDALDNQNRFQEDYLRLCKLQDSSLHDRFFQSTHTQNTKSAVDAWSKCVNSTGLWSAINLLENSKNFNIEVQYNPPSTIAGTQEGQLELLGYNDGEGFECKINNELVKNYKPTNHFILGCRLTTDEASDQNVGVYINTNYNGQQIGPFKVQSKPYLDLSEKVQQLQSALQSAQGMVKVLNNQTENSGKSDSPNADTSILLGKYPTKAVVFVSSWGTSNYSGPQANAGITLTIYRDTNVLAVSDSFEALSSTINYWTSASSVFVLDTDTTTNIRAEVRPYGDGATKKNKATEVHLSVVAIQAN